MFEYIQSLLVLCVFYLLYFIGPDGKVPGRSQEQEEKEELRYLF